MGYMKKKIKRKKLTDMNTKEKRQYVRKHRQSNRIYVKLVCKVCKRLYKIQTSDKNLHLYTDKLKNNYICLMCKV